LVKARAVVGRAPARGLMQKPGTAEEKKAHQIRADRISDLEYEHRKWKALVALRVRIEHLQSEQQGETTEFNRVWDKELEKLHEKVELDVTGRRNQGDGRAQTQRRARTTVGVKRPKFAQTAPIARRPRSVVEEIR
jgi:hypothetical protein